MSSSDSENEQPSLEELFHTIVNNSLGSLSEFENSRIFNSTVIGQSDIEETDTESTTMSHIKPPKGLVINSELDMAQEWAEWIELYEHFYNSTELSKKSVEVQASTLIAVLGREGLKVLNNLGLSSDEKKDQTVIKAKLQAHFVPSRNKTYERCQFHRIKQQECEMFEDFLQRLKTQVTRCSYASLEDEFVMDQIAIGIRSEETRQKLWMEESLDLAKTLKISRAAERAEKQIQQISVSGEATSSASVNKLNRKIKESKENDKFECTRCGTLHGRRECPAFKKECKKCGGRGHFSSMCKSKSSENTKGKKSKFRKVNKIDDSDDSSGDSDDSNEYSVHSVKTTNKVHSVKRDKWTETLLVGEKKLTVNLDTGAECSVISRRRAEKLSLKIKKSATKRLTTYNNNAVNVLGEAKAWCETSKKSAYVVFKIIEDNLTTILGQDACEELGLIMRVHKLGGELGCCKNFEYEIDFVDNPQFQVISARKVPAPCRERVKKELDNMEK